MSLVFFFVSLVSWERERAVDGSLFLYNNNNASISIERERELADFFHTLFYFKKV
jgi:hypothetical protein